MSVRQLTRAVVTAAAVLAVTAVPSARPRAAATEGQTPVGDVKRVVFVGNNWEGTVDLLAPATFERLGRINMIPDQDERMMEIATNPERLAYYLAIREAIGEGHDQLVDDMYTSNDGTAADRLAAVVRRRGRDQPGDPRDRLAVPRRRPALGPHGHLARRRAPSSSARRPATSCTRSGSRTARRWASSPRAARPTRASTSTAARRSCTPASATSTRPTDQDQADPAKGERVFQVVDADTFEVLRRYNLRKKLDAAGHEGMSTAVRPLTLSPNEHKVYFQLSFVHGFWEMNLRTGKLLRFKKLPNLIPDTPREQYVLDSAHHGIAMNPRGTKICVAGTMSDYATVVDAPHLQAGQAAEEGRRQALLGHAELERPPLLHLLERHRRDRQDLLPDRQGRRRTPRRRPPAADPQRVRRAQPARRPADARRPAAVRADAAVRPGSWLSGAVAIPG